ncbi:hypothetical protein BC628DRAFT_421893 [Trametes gibbosa]|nr:hypothetical protein BC628DRAFT_421893 [Trametes gibbosa]
MSFNRSSPFGPRLLPESSLPANTLPHPTFLARPLVHIPPVVAMHFPSFTSTVVLALAGFPPILGAIIQPGAAARDATAFIPTPVRRAPDPVVPHDLHFNPTGIALRPLAVNPVSARAYTNAELLARGLPPRRPAFNKPSRAQYAPRRRQGAQTQPQWNPKPSATPCKVQQETGIISVPEKAGFVAHTVNSFGEYGLTNNILEALRVVLKRCEGNNVPFEIATLNGLRDFTVLGGVVGIASTNDTLSKGSFNYVYVTGATSVPQGTPEDAPNGFTGATGTRRDVESVVWTLSNDILGFGTLKLNWVNPDGRLAQGTTAVFVPDANAFAVTGDLNVFREAFGTADEVSFFFLPDL